MFCVGVSGLYGYLGRRLCIWKKNRQHSQDDDWILHVRETLERTWISSHSSAQQRHKTTKTKIDDMQHNSKCSIISRQCPLRRARIYLFSPPTIYVLVCNVSIGIHIVWYSLRLPPTFSYNALGYLNENVTQNISIRKNKVHLDYNDIHFIHIYYED